MKQIPNNFVDTYNKFLGTNKFCIECFARTYSLKRPTIVNQWVKQLGLQEVPTIDIDRNTYVELATNHTRKELAENLHISGNQIDKLSEKYSIKPKQRPRYNFDVDITEFNMVLNQSKSIQDLIEHYGVKRSMITSYMLRNNIVVDARFGNKISNDKAEQIKESCASGISLVDIVKKNNISYSVLNRLNRENMISKPETWAEKKLKEQNSVFSNFAKFKQMNDTKSLTEISQTENVSIHFLKQVFHHNDEPIKIHSVTKSKGEIELKDFIQSLGIECYSTKRNFNDKTFEIDCYCPNFNIGFEYCGEYWHSYNIGTNKKYHQEKFVWCNEQNIQLITIFEHEWKHKQDIIKSIVKAKLGLAEKIHARKCKVVEIDNEEARTFHTANHVSGYVNSSINLGLMYNDKIVSVLSFIKSRFDKTFDYEISRFSTIINHRVVGGFSKLLSAFNKNYDTPSLMTYANLRFGTGVVYEKTGFNRVSTTPPNYWYYKPGETRMESRIKYQKHKLVDMNGYDNAKTEYAIMRENKFLRLYDCGNYKYVMNV